MSAQITKLAESEQEDGSRVSTPVAAAVQMPGATNDLSPGISSVNGSVETDEFSASFASMLDTTLGLTESEPSRAHEPSIPSTESTTSHQFLLPLPTPTTNRSRASFALPDAGGEDGGLSLDALPPEIASADISIAPDGSFVETSSGAAAFELKRRYDQILGVGKDVRSPYTIVSFVNQHGKPMYRVGNRELSAPAASPDEVEHKATRWKSPGAVPPRSQSPPPPTHIKRRSRMSVHSFLPPAMFHKNGAVSYVHKVTPLDGTRSPPVRKLRKTRSIPNLASPGPESSSTSTPTAPSAGRPHAHSVSSVDAFRPPVPIMMNFVNEPPRHDIFAEVLAWTSTPPSPFSSNSALRSTKSFANSAGVSEFGENGDPDNISNPFGPGVTFDSPSWRSSSHLSTPPVLREMQSFESGLTARADPQPRASRLPKLRSRLSDEDSLSTSIESADAPHAVHTARPAFAPTIETSMHSRYSTDLFDVLQNYRGLPALDKISSTSNETTIKLSIKADDTAVPRDDPRFVIWGEVEGEDGDDSLSRASITDLSSGYSGVSRKKSAKDRHTMTVSDAPFVRVPSGEAPKKVLVAATIERWIAQLTSELNYDELLIFFLTYRTYVSAVDLGHLLICRFLWALGQPTSAHDEMVRRIVRVRTFIAIRYWLLTFFAVDFVPNQELRWLFANWLNSLRKDPILERHKDASNIVMKLRKVVLDCKDAHIRKGKSYSARQSSEKSKGYTLPPALGDLSNGNFAQSLRKAVGKEDDGSDIDLDFDGGGESSGIQALRPDVQSQLKTVSNPLDLAMLRQPLHLAFLQLGKQNLTSPPPTPSPAHVPLPVPHSTLSRVFVNTIGRLGRWKRVLNSRTAARAPLGASVDVSAFDVEANETGDLLTVRGGVEQYLKMVELSQVATNLPPASPITPTVQTAPPSMADDRPVANHLPEEAENDQEARNATAASVDEASPLIEAKSVTEPEQTTTSGNLSSISVASDIPGLTMASSSVISSGLSGSIQSRDSYASTVERRPWKEMDIDVVSLDDFDYSDMSSSEDVSVPPPPGSGLKKTPRRLPTRRDFEFVRQSMDTVSSMGIRTHESVMSGDSSSVVSSISVSGGPELGGAIQQWQVNALVDSLSDDGEAGDVEDALRRLEGQINHDKQRMKQSKVDGWVQSIREQAAAKQSGSELSRYSSDEEDYGEVQEPSSREDGFDRPPSRSSVSRVSASGASSPASVRSAVQVPTTASPTKDTFGAQPATTSSTAPAPGAAATPTAEAKPAVEDVVPLEILQSRVTSRPSTSAGSPPALARQITALSMSSPSGKFVGADKPRRHRSFIMGYRAESMMQHFSMIDKELFLNLKFEELVSQDWLESAADANILDWGQFLRERARLKAEGRSGHKTGALVAVRGRFNLIANFVISEIVLTHPSERAMIASKFVRMAWKAYSMKNYNSLVAIIAGLRSDWVSKAMRQSVHRIGIWESRMLRDLTAWTTSQGDFKHIRHCVDTLAESKPTATAAQDASVMSNDGQSSTNTRSRAASEGRPPAEPACIPFFGVYLSQLRRHGELPDLIDPTAPKQPVVIDPVTNTFEAPAHPEVFSTLMPLPSSVQLEPLINVQKQRRIATVVKSLVAGQHLATKVQYPLDRKLFQKCLKLRGLDADTLLRALALYADAN